MKTLFIILLLFTTALQAQIYTVAWDVQPTWPNGTTVEVLFNGVTSSGNVGTSVIMDVPIDSGVLNLKARAIPPDGYMCGEPLVLCPPSIYAEIVSAIPAAPTNLITTLLPSTIVYDSDNFNRVSETPIAAPWISSGLRLVNNELIGPLIPADILAYRTGIIYSADQFSEYTITSVNGSMDAGAAVRINTARNTAYLLTTYNGNLNISKFMNGNFSTLTSVGSVTVNDMIRLEVLGATLKAYKNGILQGTFVDTAITTGTPGVFIYQSGAAIDNWAGGDLL